MKKIFSTIFHYLSFLLCLAAGLFVLLLVLRYRYHPVDYTPAELTESSAALSNPYCGFYQINGYNLSDSATAADASAWGKERCSLDPYPLMLLEINLKEYANTGISQTGLDELKGILDACTESKKQIILRFLYDWDGQALTAEPSSISTIQNHIRQVSGIVNAHSSCIYLLQGVFTGNNGEMNNTHFGDANSVRQLMELLADTTDKGIFLSVRTPAQLRSILRNKNALTSADAFSGSLNSRLGLFNDGMLGSVYDLGTYDDTPLADPNDWEEKGTREEEIRFQNQLCMYVPNGGEVTVDNEYNDLANAISDLASMHVSYLNADHDTNVLNKWKSTVYTGKESIFSGQTGYEYIAAHLGYRYVLDSSDLRYHPISDSEATLTLKIRNVGFAPAYRLYTTTLRLTDQKTGESTELPTTIDNRTIIGSNPSSFSLSLDVRSMKKGAYDLVLEMKDPATDLPVYFANTGYESSDTIPLGTLTIH